MRHCGQPFGADASLLGEAGAGGGTAALSAFVVDVPREEPEVGASAPQTHTWGQLIWRVLRPIMDLAEMTTKLFLTQEKTVDSTVFQDVAGWLCSGESSSCPSSFCTG